MPKYTFVHKNANLWPQNTDKYILATMLVCAQNTVMAKKF